MSEKDLESFREVLREAVAGSQLSGREAEEVLGIGHGTLGRLLISVDSRKNSGFPETL